MKWMALRKKLKGSVWACGTWLAIVMDDRSVVKTCKGHGYRLFKGMDGCWCLPDELFQDSTFSFSPLLLSRTS